MRLLRAFGGDQRTHGGPRELELQIIRFDSQHYCVTIHGRNGADDSAGSDHIVSALQLVQHLLLPLLLPLHGHKEEKVKNNANQNIRRKKSDRVAGTLLLKEEEAKEHV